MFWGHLQRAVTKAHQQHLPTNNTSKAKSQQHQQCDTVETSIERFNVIVASGAVDSALLES
jgi:hypothetical protein